MGGNGNNIFYGQKYTDRTLIESILSSFYIIDYGFIKKVNSDKTIDVTHAKQLKTLDGVSLPATVTKNVEVLTIAGSGFSLSLDYKNGDRVLLLGLKDYVPKVEDVTSATETTAYIHYSRETLKAVPLSVFDEDAKVTVEIKDGDVNIKTAGTWKLKTDKDVDIDADAVKVKAKDKIELNGNSKQFVTYKALDDALQDIWSAIKTHTHGVQVNTTTGSGTASASTALGLKTLDISASKTETVVTGG